MEIGRSKRKENKGAYRKGLIDPTCSKTPSQKKQRPDLRGAMHGLCDWDYRGGTEGKPGEGPGVNGVATRMEDEKEYSTVV